ncbi:hypothetical protein [Agrobacterium vitis]|uniref:Uncharacterized protein n=1 Tax=Agrobacterium vitis TaxID=373 RepID=A0AAE2UUC2_AGRVI|nr:hypothetical protein [Agrobacterium vitis]MBF2715231.1 hypothetical protein [Agrobacterium vitis]MUZ64965.1 hypothetical protein [Agrobacterium vitis]MVA17911.1 hypothetical protein [Agrobacterium vitis]
MITMEDLLLARQGVAEAIAACEDEGEHEEAAIYAPLFERLDNEITARINRRDTISRARQLIANQHKSIAARSKR